MMLVLHLSAGLHQGRRICAVLAFTLILIVAPTFAQTPLTPVIGVSPSPIDFGSVLVGSCEDVTADLFNVVPDPASLLEVTQITVTGEGFSLFSGPSLPVTIPGDGSTIPLVVRFCPLTEGSATGTLAVRASNAQPLDVSLLGEGTNTRGDPFSEEITLGLGKELQFEGTDGGFTLHGGDVLHFDWADGVISLNGKRFRPGPTPEEYRRWQGPRTRQHLMQLYPDVPFIQQRVSIYGNTDAGWHRAYCEWDSISTDLATRVTAYYQSNPNLNACRSFLLRFDTHRLFRSVDVDPLGHGLVVYWDGVASPSRVELPNPSAGAVSSPRSVSRDDALETLELLRWLLSGEGRNRVELRFGSLSNVPRRTQEAVEGGR